MYCYYKNKFHSNHGARDNPPTDDIVCCTVTKTNSNHGAHDDPTDDIVCCTVTKTNSNHGAHDNPPTDDIVCCTVTKRNSNHGAHDDPTDHGVGMLFGGAWAHAPRSLPLGQHYLHRVFHRDVADRLVRLWSLARAGNGGSFVRQY